ATGHAPARGVSTRARPARRAQPGPARRRYCSARPTAESAYLPPGSTLLLLAGSIFRFDERPQFRPLLGGEPARPHQMRQERRERSVAELFGQLLQAPADQLLACDRRVEDVGRRAAFTAHALLLLEPFEQLLHRAVF